ncbi:GAF domain-containing sensor histidine kinase [Mucilaginibacter lacusdianchii]|uniref:GAF domain-containing sensor histidine kinase n=1 Tax=Mucilaginibacter lacusdianchii TaxID=2684211 RepID=UPI00131D4338|nr:GAF domain-containing sensor histidine kinase [Mucilaginibacter sp. JXJ CY 39]
MASNLTHHTLSGDINLISRIEVVPSILKVICRSTGMGFAAVARVTDSQWIACAVQDEIGFGLQPGGELKLESTICNEIRQHHETVVIDHVAEDTTYCNHHTPAMYGFQSYISVPIFLNNGSFFGTLCAIDPRPNRLNSPEVVGMFELYANLIAQHLHNLQELDSVKDRLAEEQEIAALREQFIAILGHDLRNPVGAVANSARVLQRMQLPPQAERFVVIIQDAAYRITGLIENLLDFARGRLGEGITLDVKAQENLEEVLSHVVTELEVIWPDRAIETAFNLQGCVHCDSSRLAQLLSNLLGNALSHGSPEAPVQVRAGHAAEEFLLSVSNEGEPIPETIRERLFRPFSRGEVKPGQQGLGLGLYIAAEIARAHGGTLEVTSNQTATCFTLRLPKTIG